MAVATPNIGEAIGPGNTGYNASDLTPIDLSPHTGQLNTVSNGQIIEGYEITGHVRVRHDNVTFRRCRIHGSVWADPYTTFRRAIHLENCEIGVDTGYEARSFNQNNGSGVRGSDLLVWRCNIYGFEDLISPMAGNHIIAQNYLHHPYHDLNSDNYNGDTHNDPIQPPGNSPPGWSSILIQGNRFETFYFEKGQRASTTGTTMRGASTSGCLNFEHGACRNNTVRDNYIDGDYSQAMYFIDGNNNHQNFSPGPNVVIDNIFVHRRAIFGSKSFINSGGSNVIWGGTVGNRRKDNNELLAKPFYQSYQGNPNGSWSQAGPSSSYPSYGGPPPPGGGGGGEEPEAGIGVAVATPSDGATFTIGGFNFTGGADTSDEVNDSDTNYDYFDYYAVYPSTDNPDVNVEAFLDHDRSDANTGFAFSDITSDGVTFTDRSGTSHTVRGDMQLVLKGLRKDGSVPTDEITVTVGEEVVEPPPPAQIEFSPTITATMDGAITIDTGTGGIDPAFLERVPVIVPATYRVEWYWEGVDSGREVVFVGTTPVYRDQA